MPLLHEKLLNLQNAVYDIVKDIDFTEYDERLGDVQVYLGRKNSGRKAKPPLVAVWFESANISNERSSIQSVWEFDLHIIGIVKEKDPTEGREKSTMLAAIPYEVILSNRNIDRNVGEIREDEFIVGDERQEIDNHIYAGYGRLIPRFKYNPPRN